MRGLPGVLLLITACLVTGVGAIEAQARGDKPTTTTASIAAQSVLRIAMPDPPKTVDPALAADEPTVQLANLLYSGLVCLDAHYHVRPEAATRYTISPDHRTYTFYLRHDMEFSNGDPVTAGDFKFAITRSLLPSIKSSTAPTYLLDIAGAPAVLAGKAKSVSGIKVINRYTLQITARWPVPYFLMELTYPTSFALDEKAIKKLGPVDNTSWYSNPVGSGPYKLKSWSPNSQIVLVPNNHFYGAQPGVKQITMSLQSLPATDLYSYISRSVDVAPLPSDDRTVVKEPGVHETTALGIVGLYMDFHYKLFRDVRVRRALAEAIDRRTLVERAMGPSVTPFGGNVPPDEPGFDPALKPLPRNLQAARASLRDAGYTDPKKFPAITLSSPDDPAIANLAVSIANAWHRNLGITVKTQTLTSNSLVAKAQADALPLYISGWTPDYPDPHDWLSLQWKSDVLDNIVHYHNTAFDQLVEAADVTWRQDRRMQLYDQAQTILVNDVAWVPLYVPHRVEYLRPGVKNLVLTGYGLIPRGGTWSSVTVTGTPAQRRSS